MSYENNNKKFISWLEEPLERKYYTYSNNNKKIEKKRICLNGYIFKKKDYVDNFINDIEDLILSNGFIINKDKEFRDEMASFVYKYSKDE
tara:strand:+ start:275 stop:544 length:270 start_codon:yes stop_codon:yes gene_type:complete